MVQTGQNGYNPYAAGAKRYGASARSAATTGQVSANGQTGYQDRDRRNKLKQQIMLRWMQDNNNGATGTANALRRG